MNKKIIALFLGRVGLAVVGVLALFNLERSSLRPDAFMYRVMAERVAIVDKSYYVGAIDHKGPLWLGVYRLAYWLAPEQKHFWFVIAALALVCAAITGLAIRSIINQTTGSVRAANIAGLITAGYLVLGPEEYSQVLYGRNITATLVAAAVALLLSLTDPQTKQPYIRAMAAAALLGVGTQTVLTVAFPTLVATVMIAGLAWKKYRSDSLLGIPKLGVAFSVTGAVSFLSAPVWYAARGEWNDFFPLWWGYNQIYASAANRSFLEQISHWTGGTYQYFATHLVFVAIALAFVCSTFSIRKNLSKKALANRIVLFAWWLSELAAIASAQRFSDHYWILQLVPLMALLGVTIFDVSQLTLPRPWQFFIVIVAAWFLASSLVPRAWTGLGEALAFDTFENHHARRVGRYSDTSLAYRGVTDALLPDETFVYGWWDERQYVAVERPAALRFTDRRWLSGTLSDGTWSEDFVFPGWWDKAETDFEATKPGLVFELRNFPIPATSPVARSIAKNYRPVLEGWSDWSNSTTEPIAIYAKNDIELLPNSDLLSSTISEDGSVSSSSTCTLTQAQIKAGTSILIEGEWSTARFNVGTDFITSTRLQSSQETLRIPSDKAVKEGWIDASIIIGEDYAMLVSEDKILAAMALPMGVHSLRFETTAEALEVRDLETGPISDFHGCNGQEPTN